MITTKQSNRPVITITMTMWMLNDDGGRCNDLITCNMYTRVYYQCVESLGLIALQPSVMDSDNVAVFACNKYSEMVMKR